MAGMNDMAGVDWDKLSKAGVGAALSETKNQTATKNSRGRGRPTLSDEEKGQIKTKTIRYPILLEEEYKALKTAGRASQNFNDFIVQAMREKLDRDEQDS